MCPTEVRRGERAVLCFWLSTSVKLEVALPCEANYKPQNSVVRLVFTDINFFENLSIQSWHQLSGDHPVLTK